MNEEVLWSLGEIIRALAPIATALCALTAAVDTQTRVLAVGDEARWQGSDASDGR